MREILNIKKPLPAIVGAGLALTALVGCTGTTKEDSLVFEVACPENTEIDVTSISSFGVVEFHCGNVGEQIAPTSIELLSGDGITIDDNGEVKSDLLTLDYSFLESSFDGVGSPTSDVKIFDNSAKITVFNADIQGVEVSEREL